MLLFISELSAGCTGGSPSEAQGRSGCSRCTSESLFGPMSVWVRSLEDPELRVVLRSLKA